MQLYSYWRSSSAYRVRIALNLKAIEHEIIPVNLAPGVSAQLSDEYRALNPQMLVPLLVDGPLRISQSLAICDHLDRVSPDPPLVGGDPPRQLAIRSLALAIACEIQPLNNLRVLNWLKNEAGLDDAGVSRWYRHWIATGFTAVEALIAEQAGPYCFGGEPGLADCLLIPQLYNAHRFDCPLEAYPRIREVEQACADHPAFQAAHPEVQPDCPNR